MMQVLHGLEFVPVYCKGAVLAVGNFDGVHRGHQALLEKACTLAKEQARPAAVMVFEPHPREFFQPKDEHFRLTPLDTKLAIFRTLALDVAIVLPFDAGLARLDADAFISDILVAKLAVAHVVIGYDFFFGRNRGGSPDTLRTAGRKYGFGVSVIEPVAEDGEVFSSTAIRLALATGDVAEAARALGRHWRVSGRVADGAKRGAGLGYPTANVPLPRGTALGHGIYAVRVHLDGTWLNGAAYLGTRPTFDNGAPVLEVFLLDFDGDLYGREIGIEFVAFIRGDRKFESVEALIRQMDEDVARARRVLAEVPPVPVMTGRGQR